VGRSERGRAARSLECVPSSPYGPVETGGPQKFWVKIMKSLQVYPSDSRHSVESVQVFTQPVGPP